MAQQTLEPYLTCYYHASTPKQPILEKEIIFQMGTERLMLSTPPLLWHGLWSAYRSEYYQESL